MSLASGGYCPQTPIYQCHFFPNSLHKLSTTTKYMELSFSKINIRPPYYDSLKCRCLLGAVASTPPYINVISFQFHYISFQKKIKKYEAFFLKNKYQASILSDSLKCRWPLGAVAPPQTPIYQCNFFPISLHKLSKKK